MLCFFMNNNLLVSNLATWKSHLPSSGAAGVAAGVETLPQQRNVSLAPLLQLQKEETSI